MGVIIFNGASSEDFDINVETMPDYETPEKDYEVIHIPGRNGDVLIDKGTYKNVLRTYKLSIGSLDEEFTPMANRISEWLQSADGYARLEDSYEPDYYRIAMYMDSGAIENVLGSAGKTTVSFNCKPQRFFKSGEQSVLFSSSGELLNSTRFTALPIVTVHGNGDGVLQVGEYVVTVSNVTDLLVINSEIQDVYSGTINKNADVIFNNGSFPKLVSGTNNISFSGGITSVEVVPKWWTL